MRTTPVAVQEIVTFRELSVRPAGRKALPVSSRPYLVEPKSARRTQRVTRFVIFHWSGQCGQSFRTGVISK
jgi:hypothetical protein